MKLTGTVNKIERIAARRQGKDGGDEEKRVYHLTVRLPDPGLQSSYDYGYGNMNFVVHGQQMEDMVDLFGAVEVYVVRAGQGEVPDRTFQDVQAEIYRLEGELAASKLRVTQYKDQEKYMSDRLAESQARLTAAMTEALRLTVEVESLRGSKGVPIAPEPLALEEHGDG